MASEHVGALCTHTHTHVYVCGLDLCTNTDNTPVDEMIDDQAWQITRDRIDPAHVFRRRREARRTPAPSPTCTYTKEPALRQDTQDTPEVAQDEIHCLTGGYSGRYSCRNRTTAVATNILHCLGVCFLVICTHVDVPVDSYIWTSPCANARCLSACGYLTRKTKQFLRHQAVQQHGTAPAPRDAGARFVPKESGVAAGGGGMRDLVGCGTRASA